MLLRSAGPLISLDLASGSTTFTIADLSMPIRITIPQDATLTSNETAACRFWNEVRAQLTESMLQRRRVVICRIFCF